MSEPSARPGSESGTGQTAGKESWQSPRRCDCHLQEKCQTCGEAATGIAALDSRLGLCLEGFAVSAQFGFVRGGTLFLRTCVTVCQM